MKTLYILIITLALFLPASKLLAQDSNSGLKAYIAVSDKPDERSPSRKTVREFAVEETAYFAFAVSGMKRDSNNEVDLYASIEVITPEGKTLFAEEKYAPTKKVLPPEQQGLYLSRSFDLTLESSDPLGMYTLRLTVTDLNASESASTQTTILLFSSKQAKELVMSPIKSAKHLDGLWALYFKTKNPWAVKSIIRAISLKDSPEMEQTLVGRAAIWSLESNSLQNPEVYNICKSSLELTEGRMKELLEEIVASVDKKKNI